MRLATRQCGDISGRAKKGKKGGFRGLAKQPNLNRTLRINIQTNLASKDKSLHLLGPFKDIYLEHECQNQTMTIVLVNVTKNLLFYGFLV